MTRQNEANERMRTILRGLRQMVNHVCSYQDNGYFQAAACAGPVDQENSLNSVELLTSDD